MSFSSGHDVYIIHNPASLLYKVRSKQIQSFWRQGRLELAFSPRTEACESSQHKRWLEKLQPLQNCPPSDPSVAPGTCVIQGENQTLLHVHANRRFTQPCIVLVYINIYPLPVAL